MLDITLIREKPDWVKAQLRNLNDEDRDRADRCDPRPGSAAARAADRSRSDQGQPEQTQ